MPKDPESTPTIQNNMAHAGAALYHNFVMKGSSGAAIS